MMMMKSYSSDNNGDDDEDGEEDEEEGDGDGEKGEGGEQDGDDGDDDNVVVIVDATIFSNYFQHVVNKNKHFLDQLYFAFLQSPFSIFFHFQIFLVEFF